ncbi:MAG: tRNA (N6-isopentenyl adenosine(37)-C2)-methylthiotransferase MiaB [Alphaproteobacteria bacterium]|nr:tRNA (N6-isopentenyl adenosine(37)-C2)-methylthiotransferase MiaB [Alphaproteobacteria bacterium]
MDKKLYIKTWGCQMNVYDSDRMADVMAPLGYQRTATPEDADLVIFNTCHIREKASEKLFSELGRLLPFKQAKEVRGQRMIIAVAGCVAQAVGEEIQNRAPFVDIVLGPQVYQHLPSMLEALNKNSTRVLNTDFPPEPKFDALPRHDTSGISAFLPIQEGCNRFCAYCVVPYTRGAEYSRAPEDIVAEAEDLVTCGAREVTLLGQNVNAFHGVDQKGRAWNLAELLERLADIQNLKRLRFTTSHPRDMDDALIAAFRDLPKLMPFLHLPVQSGSDAILKAMNRKHTADDYRRTVDKLRDARPDLALSSDFIVGFPGETDDDFNETMRLVRDVRFAQSFSFKYSRRPGTPAATLEGQVPDDVMNVRIQELQTLLRDQHTAFNESFVGQTVPVLFDDNGQNKGRIFGRTPYLQSTFVEVSDKERGALNGQEAAVIITVATPNNVRGRMIA